MFVDCFLQVKYNAKVFRMVLIEVETELSFKSCPAFCIRDEKSTMMFSWSSRKGSSSGDRSLGLGSEGDKPLGSGGRDVGDTEGVGLKVMVVIEKGVKL